MVSSKSHLNLINLMRLAERQDFKQRRSGQIAISRVVCHDFKDFFANRHCFGGLYIVDAQIRPRPATRRYRQSIKSAGFAYWFGHFGEHSDFCRGSRIYHSSIKNVGLTVHCCHYIGLQWLAKGSLADPNAKLSSVVSCIGIEEKSISKHRYGQRNGANWGDLKPCHCFSPICKKSRN